MDKQLADDTFNILKAAFLSNKSKMYIFREASFNEQMWLGRCIRFLKLIDPRTFLDSLTRDKDVLASIYDLETIKENALKNNDEKMISYLNDIPAFQINQQIHPISQAQHLLTLSYFTFYINEKFGVPYEDYAKLSKWENYNHIDGLKEIYNIIDFKENKRELWFSEI